MLTTDKTVDLEGVSECSSVLYMIQNKAQKTWHHVTPLFYRQHVIGGTSVYYRLIQVVCSTPCSQIKTLLITSLASCLRSPRYHTGCPIVTLTHSLQYFYRSSVFTTEKKWKTSFKLIYYKVTSTAILSTTSGIEWSEWDKRRPKKKWLISALQNDRSGSSKSRDPFGASNLGPFTISTGTWLGGVPVGGRVFMTGQEDMYPATLATIIGLMFKGVLPFLLITMNSWNVSHEKFCWELWFYKFTTCLCCSEKIREIPFKANITRHPECTALKLDSQQISLISLIIYLWHFFTFSPSLHL